MLMNVKSWNLMDAQKFLIPLVNQRDIVILMIHCHVLHYQENESVFDKFQSFDKTDTVSLLDSFESWPRIVSVLSWLKDFSLLQHAGPSVFKSSHHVGSAMFRSLWMLNYIMPKLYCSAEHNDQQPVGVLHRSEPICEQGKFRRPVKL